MVVQTLSLASHVTVDSTVADEVTSGCDGEELPGAEGSAAPCEQPGWAKGGEGAAVD